MWTLARTVGGYGYMRYRGRSIGAHRVSFEYANGPIGSKLSVLHLCDEPGCVNPEHLFLGTQRDNVVDCIRKGRSCWGERSPNAKLRVEQIAEIRSSSESASVIGAKLGIHRGTVWKIRRGHLWKQALGAT